jgi:hypothetical protein
LLPPNQARMSGWSPRSVNSRSLCSITTSTW